MVTVGSKLLQHFQFLPTEVTLRAEQARLNISHSKQDALLQINMSKP